MTGLVRGSYLLESRRQGHNRFPDEGTRVLPDGCSAVLSSVLQGYHQRYWPRAICDLRGAGGFSGARIWQLETEAGRLCLRKWPAPDPDLRRLRFIHSVLAHVSRQGFNQLPAPLADLQGRSFVQVEGALWELTAWLPGKANYCSEPHPLKLVNAFQTLARFHQAAASYPRAPTEPSVSPGIRQRCRLLSDLHQGEFTMLAAAVQQTEDAQLRRRGQRVLELFGQLSSQVQFRLQPAGLLHVPLQPCIRDIWHDHVLFTETEVSGFVDFGAMRIDNVAGDIARLLGSMAKDRPDDRRRALSAYESLRPLSREECRLVEVFDQSTVLLAGINWLRWLCVEGKRFDDVERVLRRLDDIIERLAAAAAKSC